MADRRVLLALGLIGAVACDGDPEAATPGVTAPASVQEAYASEVVSFEPGGGSGFGQDALPDIVLGPPKGGGTAAGSLDVLSLGAGGEVVIGFGDRVIVDGEGPDLVVFENAFFAGGNLNAPYIELGEVAVSMDGKEWTAFPCSPDGDASGCAGQRPVLPFDAEAVLPPDPAKTGGDPFDLAEIGVKEARLVRIRDLTVAEVPPSAGFDLDAIAILHLRGDEP